MLIAPPFANYHRAELERLVQQGFDEIERRAAVIAKMSRFESSARGLLTEFDFQVLMAADAYLRSTAK